MLKLTEGKGTKNSKKNDIHEEDVRAVEQYQQELLESTGYEDGPQPRFQVVTFEQLDDPDVILEEGFEDDT